MILQALAKYYENLAGGREVPKLDGAVQKYLIKSICLKREM